MGRAKLTSKDFPSGPGDGRGELVAGGRPWSFQHVSIGNPQCAIHVGDLETLTALDLPAIGPSIEAHELFPNRTNVSWYTEVREPATPREGETQEVAAREGSARASERSGARGTIRARIFERGVGETLSSGTGATGAAIAHRLAGGPSHVTVRLDGGELDVEIAEDLQVNLTGWARPVYEGRLSEDFLKELDETE